MARIVVGCAGWSYEDWIGIFYPRRLPKTDQLAHYAKFFNFVEVNSTFYNMPAPETLAKWVEAVPDDFRFSIKIWNRISHSKRTPDIENRVTDFFSLLEVLEPKISCYLLQFPPRLKFSSIAVNYVQELLHFIQEATNVPIVVEFRDNLWFTSDALEGIVDGKQCILGTSYKPEFAATYWPGQSRYYIRCVGDRQLTDFNRIQRQQEDVVNEVFAVVKEFEVTEGVHEVFVIFNNHFTGFSPQTANEFKHRLGLPTRQFPSQKTLIDFFKK
ncbi:MAG TPA: DUF72 domain-containing protein [Candidatus Lokiarchaeia archaeon]|nr:DUF72 domain-containing protein [Candidatus Lokiarchaeia archaeon]